MKGNNVKLLACLAALALVLVGAGNALAKAKGACVNCHTMHNSQDGAEVVTGGPVEALLAYQSCYACHSGTNSGLVAGVMNGTGIPYVFTAAEPDYDNLIEANNTCLAGGNFYWVGAVDDTRGHNVLASNTDSVFAGVNPPGWSTSYTLNGAVGTDWASNQLTCAGTYGCHGDHTQSSDFAAVRGAHHGDDTTLDGTTVVKSYRFLLGIQGKEDDDWEYTKDSTDHNQYKGSADTVDKSTISYLCCECHGSFHTAANSNGESGGAPWLRHPTDYDMNGTLGTTEYLNYNTDKSYSVEAPVASTDVSAVKSTVLAGAGDAIVTCVSCHRAHGTPYADLLRWDYSTMIAGNGANTNGCFVCHTTKDDL